MEINMLLERLENVGRKSEVLLKLHHARVFRYNVSKSCVVTYSYSSI